MTELIEISPELTRDLSLLESIEQDPDVTQASLAGQLGVAVGTVNWHLKRLVSKGYVKVQRAQRRKLRYLITPKGVALRARLTVNYVERNFRLYRRTREHVAALLAELRAAGHEAVRINADRQGPEDVLDICRLTCLEQGIRLVDDPAAPELRIEGVRIRLNLGAGA
ncbi:MAG: winged helix-turn-helix transcriptional regulator [Chloroflexi bacterium]|nr:winged helix-turn-helix transcriptional regulator [Chloroflexota bacterium]